MDSTRRQYLQGREIDTNKNTQLDEQIILEASDGSRRAMAMIVKTYEKRVYGLAFKFTGNHEDAEEILQETFIKVFKGLSGFKGTSSFSTWLYRIASNEAINLVTKKKVATVAITDSDINSPVMFDWTTKPESIFAANELNDILKGFITELPAKLKIAFILKDIEQLSYEEVAAAIDEPNLNTVRTRVHRARLIVRNKLTKYLMEK